VFAVSVKIFTLTTFAVHAMIGCCMHHHHHVHAESSSGFTSSSDVNVNQNKHEHSCCNHEQVPQDHDDLADDCPTEAPCDGSHDCNEPHCTFVAAPPESLDSLVSTSQWTCFASEVIAQQQIIFAIKSALAGRSGFSEPLESGCAHCAQLQSWQF
jgi:hypothetical protein